MIKMTKKNKLRDEIRLQVKSWNNKFPIDYWWRKKYNIPFGSEQHRSANLLNMFYDYEEERQIKRMIRKIEEEKENTGEAFENIKAGKKMTKGEVDDSFDSLDLEEFN